MPAKVVAEKCIGCGTCEDVCPVGAIKLDDSRFYIGRAGADNLALLKINDIPVIDEDMCTECETCIDECPVKAIELKV